MLHVNQENGIVNGLAYRARCANPTSSTTNIELPEMSGFTNDYFNDVYYIQVIKNNDSAGNAPEGDEPRKITDYVSATGTFTVDAFSAAVSVQDEVLILHKAIVSIPQVISNLLVADYALSDQDDFDVADADANTERWNVAYITSNEGGSADINTTVAGKLMVKLDPDASPVEARYSVSHNLPLYADYFTVTADLNCTWGATDSATPKAAGMIFSAGSSYDATNYLAVERQKGTGVNHITVRGVLNSAAVPATAVDVETTDDAVAFKVQRLDNLWRFFYSTTQSPSEDWTLITQVEDPSVYMTNQVTLYFEAYSKGTADAESIRGDFDNFRYFIGSGGGGQYVAGDYSSAWVTADVDGSVLERQEAMQKAMGVLAAAGGQFEADGVPDLWDAVVVDSSSEANIVAMTGNRNGAIIERLAAIENTVGIADAGTLTGYEEDGSGANLFKTLVAKQGLTTGAGTTSTFADTARTEGDDYWIGSKIFTLSGGAAFQVRTIVDSTSGTLTVEPALAAAPGNSIAYVILNEKGSDYILGDNTSDNSYASANVIPNPDGSVLERQEFTQNQRGLSYAGVCSTSVAVGATTVANLTGYVDDYFNSEYWMRVIWTTDGAAPLGEMKKISDYTSSSGAFLHGDFSVKVDATDQVVVLHKSMLLLMQCLDIAEPVDMSAELADQSPFANLLTSDGDVSGYDRREDSLEAISDKQGTTLQLTEPSEPTWDDANKWWEGNELALLQKILVYLGKGDGANNTEITEDTSLPYIVQYLYNLADGATVTLDKVTATSILCKLAAKGAAGGAGGTFNNTTDSLEAISDKVGAFAGTAGAAYNENLLQALTVLSKYIADGDGDFGTGSVLPANKSLYNIIGATYVDAGGTFGTDSVHDDLADIHTDVGTVITDTAPLWDTTLTGASVVSGSLASFVATGGTGLGQPLPASTSLVDIIGDFTGPHDGSVQDDNIKASLDLLHTDVGAAGTNDTDVQTSLHEIKHKDTNHTFGSATDSLEAIADSMSQGTLVLECEGISATIVTDTSVLTEVTTDHYKGSLLLCTSGVNSGQVRPVISYTTGVLTVSPAFLDVTAANDDFLLIEGFKMPEWIPQPATKVSLELVAATETEVFHLVDTTNKTTYRVNAVRLKSEDPTGALTVTVRLYELINDVLVLVTSTVSPVLITTDNYATYFSLMDLFGEHQLAGDELRLTVEASAAITPLVTGQFQYDLAYTA